MTGQTISHFKVLEKLGRGGMGVVYLADDLTLNRKVALKFLPSHLSADEEANQRFIQEAHAASALNHPNVCTIHEVGKTDEGQTFIAMAHYEGETLRQKLEGGALPTEMSADITRQVAEGLAAAHEKGIIHRDIKPANIFITERGRAVVLDFGLAKLAGALDLTKSGSTLGTAYYMSPEQIRGEQVDHRTDIWSLGVVLYEMLGGQRPFVGDYEQAVSYAILNEEPPALGNLPALVEGIVGSCLKKAVDQRIQTASGVVSALKAAKESDGAVHSSAGSRRVKLASPGRPRHTWIAVGFIVSLVVVGGLWLLRPFERLATPSEEFGGRAAVAVMPFEDLSDDGANTHFAEGLTDDIATGLQSWGVFPVISRSSTRAYRGRAVDVPSVAASLAVRYMLLGSVRTAGDSVRVTAQLIDAENNTQVWASRFDGSLTDIFAIQDEITEEIITAVAPEITRSEMRRGTVERPAELATWELVIRAQALILDGTYETVMEAKGLLLKSIEREPGYAVAYVRMAEIDHNIAGYYSGIVGNEVASKALSEALDHARYAARLSPLLVDARMWYGHLLLHDRQVEDGLRELREAVRINPSHAQARAELSLGLAISGEVDAALHELSVAFRLSPNDPRNDRIQTFEALAYLYADRYEEAVESARRVIDSEKGSGLSTFAYVVEVSALVRDGRIREAKESAKEYEGYFGSLEWSAIERGAWSQSQLDRVRRDLRQVGMIP